MQGKETLSYETMLKIKNDIDKIAGEMDADLANSVQIISNLETMDIFKTDNASVVMQENFADLAKNFQPIIKDLGDFSKFLTDELNVTYSETDLILSNQWNAARESFESVFKS